jgi:hypothetical protein
MAAPSRKGVTHKNSFSPGIKNNPPAGKMSVGTMPHAMRNGRQEVDEIQPIFIASKTRFRGYNDCMTTGASILERIIESKKAGFSTEHARFILSLDFSAEEQARYDELARKVQDGALTEAEEAELNEFVAASALLTILQSKARIALKKHSPAA